MFPLLQRVIFVLTVIACLAHTTVQAQTVSADPALLSNPLRTDRDRQADARRLPLELLKFAQIAPGMNVLDVSSGGGYTAQVLTLAVGPTGRVWAQIPKPSPALEARLTAHPQANLEILSRPFEDLFAAALPRVDRVTLILSYHDIANASVDRAKMNKAIFNALKPGGLLIVIDHAAKTGSGLSDTSTLHRIDEQTVVAEFETAGFKLDGSAPAWKNPDDTHEQHSSKMTVPSDRFALRFVRPS